MTVGLLSDTLPAAKFQVKIVLSKTVMILGLATNPDLGAGAGTDLRAYTLVTNPRVRASEQDKNQIPDKDHYLAVYEADPVVADRVILVDKRGEFYDVENPLPIIQGGDQLVPNEWDEVEYVRDGCCGAVTAYKFYLHSVLVGTVAVTYESCGDLPVRYKRV